MSIRGKLDVITIRNIEAQLIHKCKTRQYLNRSCVIAQIHSIDDTDTRNININPGFMNKPFGYYRGTVVDRYCYHSVLWYSLKYHSIQQLPYNNMKAKYTVCKSYVNMPTK